jgi:hypothetical protein
MFNKLIRRLFTSQQEKSKEPWASFEITNVERDGRAKVAFSWNEAFINYIHKQGVQGMSDEESVQLFFMMARMSPEEQAILGGDETVQSAAHPNLSQPANRFYQ